MAHDVSMGEEWRLADEDDDDISFNVRRFPTAATPARALPVSILHRGKEPPATPSSQILPSTPLRSFTTRTPGVILHEATNILTYSTDRSALRPDDAEENAFATKQKAFHDTKRKGGQVPVTALLRVCDEFQRICRERCEVLLAAYPILNSDEGPFPTAAEFLRAQQEFQLLRSERDTWDLLRRLYELRGTDLLQKNTNPPPYATPHDIGHILYHTNADFRRYQIVLNWLEEISAVPVESSREKVSWRTREIIKRANVLLLFYTS